ncbi:hypothetical protein BN1708_006240 [Verticillium longisporum]|uniref:Uncharacterized protein n=1 Tax=Verticillium longisporum TaxID=100787 RepID=A0A0G4MIZ5_VERLO|nr:hypothetical protein BN1708_006240 [Verticillium longisporum]
MAVAGWRDQTAAGWRVGGLGELRWVPNGAWSPEQQHCRTLKSAQQCQVSTSGGHEPSECSVELGRYDCATNVRRAQGSWKGSRRGRMIAGTAHTGTTFVSTTTMPLFESLLLCSDRPRLLDSFAKGKKGSYCRSRAGPCGTMWAGGQGRGGRGA